MEIKKILILGAPETGKTTAMENVCEKLLQTGNLEHGSLVLNSQKIHLLNYLNHKKLEFMRHSFFKNIAGAIILIDNTKGITKIDKRLIKFINEKNIPYIIFANKKDLKDKKLKINFIDAPIIPTVAKNRESILKALEILLELISPHQEYVKNHPYVEVVKIKNHSK